MTITKIWFDSDRIYGLADNGDTLWQSLLWYKRLYAATAEQRNSYEIDSEGIHWEALDEDISFESFEYDNPEPLGAVRTLLTHPEINPSEIALRIGIKPHQMALYTSGTRKMPQDIEAATLTEIKKIGIELAAL